MWTYQHVSSQTSGMFDYSHSRILGQSLRIIYFTNMLKLDICDLSIISINRVPTQVLQSLIKSYIWFSICKAL